MKVSKKIKEAIKKLPVGTTFKYQELNISNDEYDAAAKAIERLIAEKNSNEYQPAFFINLKKQCLVN